MIAALLSDLWPYIAGLAALLAGAFGLYRKGRKDVRRETALEAAERQAKTRKRMDQADETTPSDPAVLREWMRERGQQ